MNVSLRRRIDIVRAASIENSLTSSTSMLMIDPTMSRPEKMPFKYGLLNRPICGLPHHRIAAAVFGLVGHGGCARAGTSGGLVTRRTPAPGKLRR